MKKKWADSITIVISIMALIFSIYSQCQNSKLQEKYNAWIVYDIRRYFGIDLS